MPLEMFNQIQMSCVSMIRYDNAQFEKKSNIFRNKIGKLKT